MHDQYLLFSAQGTTKDDVEQFVQSLSMNLVSKLRLLTAYSAFCSPVTHSL